MTHTLPRTSLFLALAGCGAPAPKVAPAPADVIVTPIEPSEDRDLLRNGALFLQGFNLAWANRPHRISRVAVGVDGAPAAAAGDDEHGERGEPHLRGSLSAEVRGGTWASGQMALDTPEISVLYGGLLSPEVDVVRGRTVLVLRGGPPSADGVVPYGEVEDRLTLPQGGPWTGAVAWLTSFDISTAPSHPNGYTPNALSVRLGAPTVGAAHVSVPVSAEVEAAPTIDRVQRLAEYGATVRVGYVVVLAREGESHHDSVEARLDHGLDPLEKVKKVAPVRLPLSAEVGTGWHEAVVGLSGFSLDLAQQGPVAGRYMRALTASIEDPRYDPERGSLHALASLRFTNAGSLARPAKVDAVLDWSALLLGPETSHRSGRWVPPADGQLHCARYPAMTEDCKPGTSAVRATPVPEPEP